MNIKNEKQQEGKKKKLLLVAFLSTGISLVVGLIIVCLLVMTGQTASSVFASPGDTPTPRISGIAMPGLDELGVKKGSSSTPNDNSQNGGTPGGWTTTRDVNPSNGGTSGGGSGGGNNADSYTDAGNSSAGENYCPETRADNPAVWDSCRAGYVAPTIQWGGVTSCTPIDKNAGTWSIHYKWNVVGGNWKGSWYSGANQDGTVSTTLYTGPGEANSGLMLAGLSATIMATDMNGWGWRIDEVSSPVFGGVVMNTVCH